MDQLEKVEKLREKTGVTYDEAKQALEESNWDVLDAIVYLEKSGKIKNPQSAAYTTKSGTSEAFNQASQTYEYESSKVSVGEMVDKFFKWCGKVIKKGCENFFEINKDGRNIVNMPVIILAALLIFAFWITLPLLVIGLFFGFHYSFRGDIAKTVDLNSACDKASETCENIKKDFKSENK